MLDFIYQKVSELGSSGTTGIITLLLIGLVLVGIIKGVTRLVFLLCSISGAFYASYWGYKNGIDAIKPHWSGVTDLSGTVMALLLGLVTFFVLSKIFAFLANPFEKNSFISKFSFGIPGTIVSAVIATIILFVGVYYIQEKGVEQEIRYLMNAKNADKLKKYPMLATIKNRIEASSIWKKLGRFYGKGDNEKHDLAKLIVIANTSKSKYDELSKNKLYTKILANPKVRRVIVDNPKIQRDIRTGNVEGLLSNPELVALLKDPDIISYLEEASAEEMNLENVESYSSKSK